MLNSCLALGSKSWTITLDHYRSRADSDIDLLVLPLAAARYWDFKRELEEVVNFPVDLHTQDDDPLFVEKVLSRGEVVYDTQSS